MASIGQGALIAIAVGLFITAMGVFAIVDPKLQGARDVNIITSDEVGSGERVASRVGGVILTAIGLFILFLVVYISHGSGF